MPPESARLFWLHFSVLCMFLCFKYRNSVFPFAKKKKNLDFTGDIDSSCFLIVTCGQKPNDSPACVVFNNLSKYPSRINEKK